MVTFVAAHTGADTASITAAQTANRDAIGIFVFMLFSSRPDVRPN
jgi:hypothetical protein